MRNINQETVTHAVLASMSNCGSERLLSVMKGLVQHLHAFASEVKLTEDEWFSAIQFLTEVGVITNDNRQEFVLLSDTLGLSMLVTAQNNRKPAACTEATVLGPFYVEGAPEFDNGDDVSNGAPGMPCFVSGTVRGLKGGPVAGASLDIWQSDEDGFYDVQKAPDALGDMIHRARGRLHTRADGSFNFRSILAEPYSVPHDGPVGRMLDALGRSPWRPAHLHFWIRARGYEPLITHVFRNDDPYLDSDPVFGVRSTLIIDWIKHGAGVMPDGSVSTTEFYTLDYDFVLNPLGNLA